MKGKSIFYITCFTSITLVAILWLFYSELKIFKTTRDIPAVNLRTSSDWQQRLRIQRHGQLLKKYAAAKYNTSVCFLIDMKIHSGKKRFFIYDLRKDSVLHVGLAAHGNCNYGFLRNPRFGNDIGCGCSSLGKYAVSYKYEGRFGTAFKLKGLDATNNNAFNRAIVLHSYSCVPDEATYPKPLCNSLGCPMVSINFFTIVQQFIERAEKPILLWTFN